MGSDSAMKKSKDELYVLKTEHDQIIEQLRSEYEKQSVKELKYENSSSSDECDRSSSQGNVFFVILCN